MCGLVGCAGNIYDADKKAIKTLLVLDALRGEDSTGVALVDRTNNNVTLAKEIGDPYNMFNAYACFDDKGVLTGQYKVVLGHNRFATKGEVNRANAHPFSHDHIVGAHNGTLRSLSQLKDGYKFDVDSEAIFYNLAADGAQATIPRINGAYALVWYDSVQEKVFFIRNNERPLFYARRDDKDAYFWASEEWMLMVAASKNSIKIGEIKKFEINHLYSLDVSESYMKFRDKALVDEGELKGWQAPATNPTNAVSHKNPPLHVIGGKNSSTWVPPNNTNVPNIDKLNSYVGKEVEFYVEDEDVGESGLHYLKCKTTDMEDVEIRIFAHDHKNWQKWLTEIKTWKCKIKKATDYRVNGKIYRYLIPDIRTIVEVLDIVDKPKDKKEEKVDDTLPFDRIFIGYNGKELTYTEWIDATSNGCTWCSSAPINVDEKISWIDKNDFLCEECQKSEEVMTYLPQLNYKIN